jgi:PKD repeat protein
MLYLQAEDSDGNLGPVSALLIQAGDNQSPIAAFSIDCNHLECSFDGSNSSDDTGIVSYQWQLSDGSEYTGTSFQHTFATSGTYSVELTVTDTAGATGVNTQTVTVQAAPSSGGGVLGWLCLLLLTLVRYRVK